MNAITGIHHVTTIAADAARSVEFYTKTLGLTLICKTVNFDEPSTLHFYCGDKDGSPGSLITFFIHKNAGRGHLGLGQVSAMSFAVPSGSLPKWRQRLEQRGVLVLGRAWSFGEEHLCFSDPDGLELTLVEQASPAPAELPQTRILHISAIEIHTEGWSHACKFLVDLLGFKITGTEQACFRLESGAENGATIDLVCAPNLSDGVSGAGIAHHVAWRVRDEASLNHFVAALTEYGTDVSLVLDREFFRAVYFRGLGGVRLALATDGPGFAPANLRKNGPDDLHLPPWLEPRRQGIERRIKSFS